MLQVSLLDLAEVGLSKALRAEVSHLHPTNLCKALSSCLGVQTAWTFVQIRRALWLASCGVLRCVEQVCREAQFTEFLTTHAPVLRGSGSPWRSK